MNTRSVLTGLIAVVVGTLTITATAGASFGLSGPLSFAQSASSNAADPTFPADPGDPFTQAGGHPYETTVSFELNVRSGSNAPDGDLKDLGIDLPRGVYVNPQNAARCPLGRLVSASNPCPVDAQVGIAAPSINGSVNLGLGPVPIYNLAPEVGQSAEFGFVIGGSAPIVLYAGLEAGPGYRLHIGHLATPPAGVTGLSATFWGVPSDPSHDAVRAFPRVTPLSGSCQASAVPCEFGASSSTDPKPFLTNSADCSDGGLTAALTIDSYQETEPLSYTATSPQPSGCGQLGFNPALSVYPDNDQAETPAGYTIDLGIPQADGAERLATPPLRDATITLPAGVSLSPATADGLRACSPQQVRLDSTEPATCPASSQIAVAQVHTPLLGDPLPGRVYLGTPECGPCSEADAASGRMIRLYIEVEGSGLDVKLPGFVSVDPTTGQLTATFQEAPQLPFDRLRLELKSGPRAMLSNPDTCGTATATSKFTPWSAPATPDAAPASSFEIGSGPNGGDCAGGPGQRQLAPTLSAGTLIPTGGEYSPFTLRLGREDGQQQFSGISVTAPPGLVAKVKGVPSCSDAAIASARGQGGQVELSGPSCPASSQIGTVSVAAGPGPHPLYISGKAYLAGPYKGAPLSLAVVVPVVAGPFDLGTVAVRAAINVDPLDAHLHVVSDPLPRMLDGVPLDIRDIRVNLDRPSFTLNPTNCRRLSLGAEVLGNSGGFARVSSPFQARACGALPFGPRQWASLKGGTKRNQSPAFKTTILEGFAGEANPESVVVSLPHSEFLEQSHIQTICTRVQFSEHNCPAKSIYGHAMAVVPALDYPLEGPVYLRSSSHTLPDLVIALKGPPSQPIEVDLAGYTESTKAGGIRTIFDSLPDAEIAKFSLSMQGGKKGLLVNSTDICAHTHRFTVKAVAYNGRVVTERPLLRGSCGKGRGRPGR